MNWYNLVVMWTIVWGTAVLFYFSLAVSSAKNSNYDRFNRLFMKAAVSFFITLLLGSLLALGIV
jgi:hypothetical protein